MTDRSPADGHPRRRQILAVMCTSLVLVVAGVSSLNLALPSIRDALQPSNTELLWIVRLRLKSAEQPAPASPRLPGRHMSRGCASPMGVARW